MSRIFLKTYDSRVREMMKKYTLEITVFVCGAIVMIFELVGSRVLGPYLGTSTFVWTTLIGIVMGSLSLGYYLGGKLADQEVSLKRLSLIILGAGIFILLTFFLMDLLLFYLFRFFTSTKLILFIASIILFTPASFLLGMISPYAAKLKLHSLKSSGTTIGNLYALSTLGSIVGTFLAGFYFIPTFGTGMNLLIIATSLIVLSLFIVFSENLFLKIGLFVIALSAFSVSDITTILYASKKLVDIDTEYTRVFVFEGKDIKTNRPIKSLRNDIRSTSAIFMDGDDLVYEYLKFYDLVDHFKKDFKKVLLLGGGAYTYPKYFLKKHPQVKMDVVEIDPKLVEIAEKHFGLQPIKNLKVIHQDARIFLNKNKNKYDIIFGDAFNSQSSIPFHLTTKEAVQKKFDALSDDGMVVLNVSSSIEGKRGKFLRAEYQTYKNIFPQVYVFLANHKNDAQALQNIILFAFKSKTKPSFESADDMVREKLSHLWTKKITQDVPILTDDYAPVGYYAFQTNLRFNP